MLRLIKWLMLWPMLRLMLRQMLWQASRYWRVGQYSSQCVDWRSKSDTCCCVHGSRGSWLAACWRKVLQTNGVVAELFDADDHFVTHIQGVQPASCQQQALNQRSWQHMLTQS
jgi:hypothetical protein